MNELEKLKKALDSWEVPELGVRIVTSVSGKRHLYEAEIRIEAAQPAKGSCSAIPARRIVLTACGEQIHVRKEEFSSLVNKYCCVKCYSRSHIPNNGRKRKCDLK